MSIPPPKSFDYAIDATKQVMAICTGVLTISITLFKDSIKNCNYTFLLYSSWAALFLSLVFGVLVLGALIGSTKENEDNASIIIDIYKPNIKRPTIVQWSLFIIGMGLFGLFGALHQEIESPAKPTPIEVRILE